MVHELKQFWQDESGPELVEWAVVTIILLVAAVLAYRVIGNELKSTLERIAAWITCVREGTGCPGG